MKSRHLGWLGAVVLLPVLGIFPSQARSAQVIQVDVEHVIHPLTVELVQEAVRQAGEEGAAAVLLRLNTPGGLLSAAKDVIQTIVASDVPIIAYVGPSGGRAASAGFMILVSADVAAMAPGTNTGAAHPVLMGGEMDEVMKAKVSNDTAASVPFGHKQAGAKSGGCGESRSRKQVVHREGGAGREAHRIHR